MSAYMVNEDTLDLLASVTLWDRSGLWLYAGENTLPPRSELETSVNGIYYTSSHAPLIKEELRLENIASLWGRYPKDADTMAGNSRAKFRAIYDDQATIQEALGALRCYEYQACESENWQNSYAFAICQAIKATLIAKLSDGYWEYERPAGQAQRVSLMDLL